MLVLYADMGRNDVLLRKLLMTRVDPMPLLSVKENGEWGGRTAAGKQASAGMSTLNRENVNLSPFFHLKGTMFLPK